MTQFQRPLGASFNAREAEPTPNPTPEVKPATEGTPTVPGYLGHAKSYPPSAGRDDLAPAFSRFSDSLKAELSADEAIRREKVNEALGLTGAEKLRAHREALAQGVKAGDMSEAEAQGVWQRAHPGIDPASL